MILSGDDSVFLLSFWLRLCRAVLIAPLRFHGCPHWVAAWLLWDLSRLRRTSATGAREYKIVWKILGGVPLFDPPLLVWWRYEKPENRKQEADADFTDYHGAAGAGERWALGEAEYVGADVPDLRVAQER